jgi:hypothetical protein
MEPDKSAATLPLLLRTGVAMCFVGHGAFGLMTKAAWVPYFGVVGIGEARAWQLMPWIGGMDVAMGFLAFIWPCRALFLWAAAWAGWTALLRPLAGQGWPEFFERAGNYGVPVAILLIVGLHGRWFARLPEEWTLTPLSRHNLERALRALLAALLAGHACCALLLKKAALAHHYEVFGVAHPMTVMGALGWFELLLAVAVLAFRVRGLVVFVAGWKIATEALFLTSGTPAPLFEMIERGGSYIVPLALAYLLTRPAESVSLPQPQFSGST